MLLYYVCIYVEGSWRFRVDYWQEKNSAKKKVEKILQASFYNTSLPPGVNTLFSLEE
jgi:hypothetical protein